MEELAVLRPDGSFGVVQTLPGEMRCWGCGSGIRGTYNRDHIQFELCQDDRSDPDWCKKCYDKAVELCAYLCRRYGFGAEAIVDHAEAHARGYASNHGDTDDWFPLHGRNMDSLRREVQALLDGRKSGAGTRSKTGRQRQNRREWEGGNV